MTVITKLVIEILLPVLAVFLYDKIEHKSEKLGENNFLKTIILGFLFGLIAVICKRNGVVIGKAIASTRDAAVLTAGLFISGPVGVIAGVIALIDSIIEFLRSPENFTAVADIVTVIATGLIAFLLRKVVFEDKRPNWFMSLFSAFVVEVFYLTLIISTNMTRPEKVIAFINSGTAYLLLTNCISVIVVSVTAYFFSTAKADRRKKPETKSIFETIQTWLLNVIIISFLCVSGLMVFLEMNLASSQIEEQFVLAMDEVAEDVLDASDRYQISITQLIAADIEDGETDLADLANWYGVSEINVVDNNGIITSSSNPEFIGFDMESGEQSAEFLSLLNRTKLSYAQEYRPISADGNTYMKYAAVKMKNGFVQMGYNAESFHKELNKELKTSLKNRHVGKTGFFIVLDENKQVVSTSSNFSHNYKFAVNQIDMGNLVPNTLLRRKINGDVYYCMYNKTEGYNLMAFCSVEDAMITGTISIYTAVFNMIIVFAVLFILVYILIKKLVVNQIITMANSLARITQGDLNEVVNVRSNAEFASLSDDINTTVNTLKRYIDEAASRIDAELEFAKSVQLSAMPNQFPAFPNRTDMDIYARMDTAKEIGGDFYDFYFTDKDVLNFMIADVSGKGIPAAMFMMRAKSVLRGQATIGDEINDVFTKSNDMLCAENEANMFVTAWQGQIDLTKGLLCIANAGHNPAIIKRNGGKYEYLRLKPNLVLASMDGISYRKHEIQLNKGDIIYLYTDGVTEATNINNELYGEDRLLDILNKNTDRNVQEICDLVKSDVDLFVGDAPQFDDITMVAFEYMGPES
ncbi:MAG: SpoIIE family protein phosphatase [Lachnospiraceae bacterium]|nr:SpoIIE family protein phosphatase [Lachnospiraceae bacterium]